MKLLLSCIFLFILFVAPIQAQNATDSATIVKESSRSGIEIEPAVIDVDIDNLAAEKEIEINLTNHNNETIVLDLYAINFRQKDLSGITQFLGEDSETFTYSLASYIHLPFNEIELEPGEKRSVPVEIRNRQDLSPGGHYAGIIARQQPGENVSGTTTILPSISSLIFLKKTGGEQYNLSIQDVNWPQNTFETTYPENIIITFQNEGNVHLIPRGRIEIKDMFGRLVSKGTINTASSYVFPSSRRQLDIEIKELRQTFPVSFNTFVIRGNDSLEKTTFIYEESYIYIDPVSTISLLIGAITIIVAIKKNKIKIKKWSKK